MRIFLSGRKESKINSMCVWLNCIKTKSKTTETGGGESEMEMEIEWQQSHWMG